MFSFFRYAFVYKKAWLAWFLANGFLIFAMFVLCLTFLVVFLLFCCHSYLMFTAQTTWEYMSRSRISYLKTLSEDVNPFDQGVFCNVYSFLCRCRVQKWEVLLRQRDRWAQKLPISINQVYLCNLKTFFFFKIDVFLMGCLLISSLI